MPEPTDIAPETEANHSPGWGRYVIWLVGIVIVYVLSTGPALRLNHEEILSDNVMRIYVPIDSLYENTFLRKPLGMYWHLWWPRKFDSDGEPIPISVPLGVRK